MMRKIALTVLQTGDAIFLILFGLVLLAAFLIQWAPSPEIGPSPSVENYLSLVALLCFFLVCWVPLIGVAFACLVLGHLVYFVYYLLTPRPPAPPAPAEQLREFLSGLDLAAREIHHDHPAPGNNG
jgi:hypothetical protein